MEDRIIIDLYFARNEQAIYETDQKYGKLCFSVANNVLPRKEDSEECVNDTYMNLWESIPPTRPYNFMAYICKVVRNLSLKKYEYIHALKRTPEITVSFSELKEIIADKSFNPECSDTQIRELISNFLRGEKKYVRDIFIRRYFFFDSIADIASRYSSTDVKIKNTLYHTRKKLKLFLRKEGVHI